MLECLILVGGFGTRLQSVVNDRPKPLALIQKNKTFLDFQIDDLRSFGIKKITLLTHHLHEHFVEHFRTHQTDLDIQILKENTPLGTGGSIVTAIHELNLKNTFLVLNGDSFLKLDFNRFINERIDSDFSIVASYQDNASRYGQIVINETNEVIQFQEKTESALPGLVNAGIYRIHPKVFSGFLHHKNYSLEKEIIPQLLSENKKIHIFLTKDSFIDIGTPESYDYFKSTISKIKD